MKKKLLLLALIALSNSIIINAQEVIETMPSMNVNPIFIGGNLVIGGGTGTFQLGLNPEIYKRVNDYVDIGGATNLFFQSFNPTISNGLPGTSSRSIRFGAESLLAGIGYGTRSENGMTYFSVMIDLLKNPNSPYRDGFNRADPIIRAGFAFPILGAKKKQP